MRSPIRAGRKMGCRTPKKRILDVMETGQAIADPSAKNRPGWYCLWENDGLYHRMWEDEQFDAKNAYKLAEIFAECNKYYTKYAEIVVLGEFDIMTIEQYRSFTDVTIYRRY